MKLKVICQNCGRTGETDTSKPCGEQGWHWYTGADFEFAIENPTKEDLENDIWLCYECNHIMSDDYPDEYETLAQKMFA